MTRCKGPIRRPKQEVAETIGCGALLVWPLVSAGAVLALFVWSPPESNTWLLALVVLAALWFPQLYWSDQLWHLADGLAARLDRPEPNRRLRAVQRVLVVAESLRVTLLPLLIGAWIAAFPSGNSTLATGFLIVAAAGFALIYWLQIEAENSEDSDQPKP
jgi:hypothetical protein